MDNMIKKRPTTVGCSCPTCGQPMRDAELRVDLEANAIVCGDRSIQVGGRFAEIVFYLLQNFPRSASHNSILLNVWANVEVNYNTVTSAISKSRDQLEMLGWTIKLERRLGYRLVRVDAPL